MRVTSPGRNQLEVKAAKRRTSLVDQVLITLIAVSLLTAALFCLLASHQKPSGFIVSGLLILLMITCLAYYRWQRRIRLDAEGSKKTGLRMRLVSLLLIVLLIEGVTMIPLATDQPEVAVTEAATSPALANLKNTFMVGLANGPGQLSWMTDSGIPWDMRSQFLIGDVTANDGWVNWNQPAGSFASYFMNASAANKYIPILTYYTMYYSSPGKFQSNESQRSLVNLKTPATMKAYFTNFKLLMDKAREFGQPVIVQIEPDFWGFVHQASIGDNPATVPATINSSGFGDVAAGKPDNVAGFAQTLIALRDKYASNVILTYHVSNWSAGNDVATNTSPTLDVTSISNRIAKFYNSLGARFDLLTFDVADRDAAYSATKDNAYWKHWWDTSNQTFPNFERFRTYMGLINSLTKTKSMLVGVPMGNRFYRSENNTNGHYQDNRVEYFLGPNYRTNLQAWINSGLIGILWGDGASDQTTYWDRKNDGITNPAPINGNNLSATVGDDDGGYVRERGRNYYQNGPLALTTGTPPPSPTVAPPTATTAPPPKPTTATPVAPPGPTTVPATTVPATTVPATTVPATTVAATSNLKVQYRTNTSSASDNQIEPRLKLVNTGSTKVALSELKVRYYFTADTYVGLNYYCDYAVIGCANIKGQFVKLPTPISGADTYLEVSFTAAAGGLAPGGGSADVQLRIARIDWNAFNETNDYSFDASKLSYQDWSHVTLYRNGGLAWGIVPK